MQLCEFCAQYTDCSYPKRLNRDPNMSLHYLFTPCESFEKVDDIPQPHYGKIKDLLLKVRDESKVPEEIVVNIDVPLEITARGYPSDSWMVFLNTDFTDKEQSDRYIDRYIAPYVSRFSLNYAKELGLYEDLQKAQQELQDWIDGKASLEVINKYLRNVSVQLYLDPQKIVKTQFKGPLPGALSEGFGPIALPFLQIIERNVKKLPAKRCPICQAYFDQSVKRGPRGATCGKPKCRKAFSDDRERYVGER